jgi:hypothetical protein
VRKIHKIPSKQGRFWSGLGPPQGAAWGAGSQGAIVAHGSSVHADMSLAISFLLVMANYPLQGQQNAREVVKLLLVPKSVSQVYLAAYRLVPEQED